MELDEESLDGHWSINNKTGMDFFIINDAIFSKLCILGDDVEPCFEGARITAPEVSTSFSKIDDNFKKTLYTMMQDLKFALEGGQKMTINEAETTAVEQSVEAVEETEEKEVAVNETSEEMSTEKDNEEQSVAAEIDNPTEDLSSQENFAKADDEEKKEESDKEESEDSAEDSEDKESDSKEEENSEEDEEDKKKKDYSLLETELEQAKIAYADLEEKYQALVAFKEQVDNEKKDALIGSFYMLSDEDKKDVIENKSKYSLDEIEAKLSVICVRKKVNFDLEDASKKDDVEKDVVTYTVNDNENSTPAWIAALKNTRDSRK